MGYDIDVYQPVGYVPVLYLNSNTNSDNVLIYFHANGEDIFSSYPLLNHLRQNMEVTTIFKLLLFWKKSDLIDRLIEKVGKENEWGFCIFLELE